LKILKRSQMRGMDQFKYFHQEVRAQILSNIENKDFNVKNLSASLGISRSQLYRKIKKATGLSVAGYIKNIRLKESQNLLTTTDWTISKIALTVGFKSSSYFTYSYKKLFGHPPSFERKSPLHNLD